MMPMTTSTSTSVKPAWKWTRLRMRIHASTVCMDQYIRRLRPRTRPYTTGAKPQAAPYRLTVSVLYVFPRYTADLTSGATSDQGSFSVMPLTELPNLALVGATGAVGRETIAIIESRTFPHGEL